MKDIASLAGVSVALVSYVLNDKCKGNRVNDTTAERVRKIADELGYRPNAIARSLRSGKTHTIGVVVSDISNQFFAHVARSMEDAAGKLGYTVFFGSSDESVEKMDKLISGLWDKGVDGMIVVPCEQSGPSLKRWVEQQVPMVLFDRPIPELPLSSVALDNLAASSAATHHLLDSGYRKIVMITYESEMKHMHERVQGYVDEMKQAGLERELEILKWTPSVSKECIANQLSELIQKGTEAMIFSTNTLALWSLPVLMNMKVDIPNQVGVVCFDESEAFSLFSVPLTYVRQPVEDLSLCALKQLIHEMEGQTKEPVSMELPPQLMIRSSSIRSKSIQYIEHYEQKS